MNRDDVAYRRLAIAVLLRAIADLTDTTCPGPPPDSRRKRAGRPTWLPKGCLPVRPCAHCTAARFLKAGGVTGDVDWARLAGTTPEMVRSAYESGRWDGITVAPPRWLLAS